ncbi:MAG: prolyl oligopeptidase family serine peptidase, partial [Myxococcales bacterium]
SPSDPQARPMPVDDLFFTRAIFGPAWSPDSREIAFTTNLTGRNNLWKVAASGGWPIQLSQSDDRQTGAAWSPDGKWVVYQSDVGGHEYYDLFAIPAGGGAVVNLTGTPDSTEVAAHFSRDGRQVLVLQKPKTSPTYDVAVMDWATRKVRNLTNEDAKDHTWTGPSWSPDGRFVYATRYLSGFTDADVYRIDAATGAKENLTAHQGSLRFVAAGVSADGRTVLITGDKPGGFPNVALLDVASRKLTWVTDTQREASASGFSRDGRHFAWTVNQDGRSDVYVADTATRRARKLALPAGLNELDSAQPFSPDGRSLLVVHQASNEANDIWVYDLAANRSRQLTFSAIASLRNLPPAQLVHYASFDGRMISAFLWMPFNLQRDGTHPAVVLPHGGPTSQTVDLFNRTAEALASRGYVCIAPNVRGSTGYGMAFQKANFQDLGGGDLQDEVYAVKFLEATGFVDAKRIGITGGSYGGYMTLMAIGKTPGLWAAAVEQYGIIDWYTMLQHEDPFLQEYEKSLLGDPVKDRAVYEAASPIKYLREAKAPLLVLQGDNDIRVPKEEAEQVVSVLKQQGGTFEAKYYPNEGHGFAKRENQIDAIRRTLEWFDKHLAGSRP